MTKATEDLEAAGLTLEEAAAVAVPEAAPTGLRTDAGASKTAVDYLHVTHPDTGLEVVFVPGERLPEWAQKIQAQKQAALWDTPADKPAAKGRKSIKAGENPTDRA